MCSGLAGNFMDLHNKGPLVMVFFMLQEFIDQVCAELSISPTPLMDEKKTFFFLIGVEVIEIKELLLGFALKGKITPCPEKKREELFLKLSLANYLGQQTGISRIGLSLDEKDLTLSLEIPYETTYRAFREHLEEFVNFILYWRKEVKTFETLETLL